MFLISIANSEISDRNNNLYSIIPCITHVLQNQLDIPLAHTYFEMVLEDLLENSQIDPIKVAGKVTEVGVLS